MVELYECGVYLLNGKEIIRDNKDAAALFKSKTGRNISKEEAKKGTIAYSVIHSHNHSGDDINLQLKFDSLTSHDLTYVGIIQTARASGMEKFSIRYVMTNCHNSLCAVGGTINEDDHMFALSAANKYGGIFVPPNLAVIHSYNREMMSGCGRMILGSDSHTRYGALGTMGVGEGGGELTKQLLGGTYDLKMPGVVAIYLTGKPHKGVGPQDVALSIVGKVFSNGYVKNKVMEFVGDGIANLNAEYRNGIDVMTTETACWSSVWQTDEQIEDYYKIHGRAQDYKQLKPEDIAYYDGMVYIDLATIKPSIALPFHPSNVYTIEEVKANVFDIFRQVQADASKRFDDCNLNFDLSDKIIDGQIHVDQGIIAGCSGGTYDNIVDVASILEGKSIGNGAFKMSVYPASQPEYLQLVKDGTIAKLMSAGVVLRSCFCGPCFGAGDTPADHELSIRHTTRNFPNREGSKPSEGQLSYVALMDARSIAATAVNGGILTAATDLDISFTKPRYYFDKSIYDKRVFDGFHQADPSVELKFGPNIKDWPKIPELTNSLLVKIVSYITDPVTTTDELIPSGETSSYRSDPLRLAEFTLGRKDPDYVRKAKEVQALEVLREKNIDPGTASKEITDVYKKIQTICGFENINIKRLGIGSAIYAKKPGDGSAREQAASCQKVLGGWANFAREYATKRYCSNLINWGIIPFLIDREPLFQKGEYIFLPNLKETILNGTKEIKAYVIGESVFPFTVWVGDLTEDEKRIIAKGCLINFNRATLYR
jgi:aconitate hydratase